MLTLAVICLAAGVDVRGIPPQTPVGSAPASGQAAAGTAFILGQIVDAAGGGVPGAVVTLSGGLVQMGGFNTNLTPAVIPGGPRRALTNASGRFLFSDLPKGAYSIDATKPGYVAGAYGRHRPGGIAQSIEIGEGERNGSVKIALWKYASISGTAIDDAGEPIVGAQVMALRRTYEIGRAHMTQTSAATTDDRGAFRIASLTPGEYVVSVTASQSTAPAALVDAYAQARLAGTTAEFSRQMNSAGGSIAAIMGGIRVGDYVLQSSGPYSRSGAVPPEPSEDGKLLSFQTTFYPGVFSLAQAEVITLASGDERTGTPMHLTLVPTVPVSGTVVGPDGPMPNIAIRMAPAYANDVAFEQTFDTATTVTDANGAFKFLGVPVGQYSLRVIKVPVAPPQPATAMTTTVSQGGGVVTTINTGGQPAPVVPPSLPQGPTLWANMPLAIGEDGASNVTVRLNSGFRIRGRFEFDGAIAKPPPGIIQTLSVLIQPIDGHQSGFASALRARVDPDGSITTYEVPPGKYSIRMAAPIPSWQAMAGWTFRSSVVDGKDVAATPLNIQSDIAGLVITMTDHPSELTGTVRDERGRTDPTAAVIVFSADRGDWSGFGETPRRLRHLRASKDGVYRISALPPGDYFIAAIPDAQASDWQDPRFLLTLSRTAVRITLNDGDKRTQDVVTRAVR